MIKLLSGLLQIILCVPALADMPPQNIPYTLLSNNGQFKLRSIPYARMGAEGKSFVYNTVTNKQSYTAKTYLDMMPFLSDNGQYIAWVGLWGGFKYDNDNNEVDSVYGDAIRFYAKGKLIKKYSITDLVENKQAFYLSVSHARWKYEVRLPAPSLSEDSVNDVMGNNNAYQSNDTLYITTAERKLLVFDIRNGNIIRTEDAARFYSAKGFQFRFPVPQKTIIPDERIVPYELPAFLKNGKSFTGSLAASLDYRTGSISDHDIRLYLFLQIDRRTGKFKILNVYYQTIDRKSAETSGNKDLVNRVRKWLTHKRFDTARFAGWIEKWSVGDYLYFKFQ